MSEKTNKNNVNTQYNIEQTNQYLEELGLEPNNYGVNFTQKGDQRREVWEEQKKLYGFDERETWNLNNIFVEWLYCHCKMYLDKAGNIINLDYYKFEFEGIEYTQREAIEYIIEKCKPYLTTKFEYSEDEDAAIKGVQKAINLWSMVFPAMWW